MIKMETHCHTYLTSSCANTPNDIIIKKYVDAGYKIIVTANHVSANVYNYYLGEGTHKQKMDKFFKFNKEFGELAKESGITVFSGAEIRVNSSNPSGTEYMVLNLDEKYYYDYKLFELDQQRLFELVEKSGAFMYQTHPFRNGVSVGDPAFMHGAEAFNGHYHHVNNNDKATQFCLENNLIGLAGSDYHHPDQPITAGITVDGSVTDMCSYVEFIKQNKHMLIQDEKTYFEHLKAYREGR
ncbi:MAG: hypothetical protein IJC07_02190 [Clostridia bacterium]|nr:hypothetical protein [Clostridia bacterium]